MKFDISEDFDGIGINSKPELKAQFLIIFGPPGVGKTTLATHAPNPVILPVGNETGHNRFGVPKFTNEKGIDPVKFVYDCMSYLLKTEHSRKTLIIDNGTTWREIVINKVIQENPVAKDGDDVKVVKCITDYGWGRGYALAMPYWNKLLTGINALIEKGINVIFIHHEASYNVNLHDGSYYQLVSVDAPRGEKTNVANELTARCDHIIRVTNEPQTILTKAKSFGKTKRNVIKQDSGIAIHTRPNGQFFAKTRGGEEVEDIYQAEDQAKNNPTYTKIFEDLGFLK